jgi:hypothetical protein
MISFGLGTQQGSGAGKASAAEAETGLELLYPIPLIRLAGRSFRFFVLWT